MTEYGYEIWYEGQAIQQSANADDWYDTEAEAEDEAELAVSETIDEWKSDGVWAGEVAEDFDIKIVEREVNDE